MNSDFTHFITKKGTFVLQEPRGRFSVTGRRQVRSPFGFAAGLLLLLGHAAGGAVGSCTAIPAGRPRFRYPMVSLESFIDNPSGRTLAPGFTESLTEMSTRNISWRVKAACA